MKIARFILLSLLFIMGALFFIRVILPSEVDDIHPDIACESWIVSEADVLWVIPLFNNHSIGSEENSRWCSGVNNLNKTLGLHGVYHEYEEFTYARDDTYIENGITAFEQCFGRKPDLFKAPQVRFAEENSDLLEQNNLEYRGKIGQVFHKVYHCGDTGMFPNWVIRAF